MIPLLQRENSEQRAGASHHDRGSEQKRSREFLALAQINVRQTNQQKSRRRERADRKPGRPSL
jgi:hypothetical protein